MSRLAIVGTKSHGSSKVLRLLEGQVVGELGEWSGKCYLTGVVMSAQTQDVTASAQP